MPASAVPVTALVLTAGLGTRLRPLSQLRAKPALPVAGEALVCRIIRWLAAYGVRDLVLNLHHRPDTITAAVGDGARLGVRVRYSWEPVVLGSGGGPARAFTLVSGDELLIVNGDTLTDLDLAGLTSAHRSSGALVTLGLIENPRPARYGSVRLDAAGVVEGFTRRGHAGWHFVGAQIAEREAYAGVPVNQPSESIGVLYPALIASRPGSVRGWCAAAAFDDIGTPADYLAANLRAAAADPSRLIEPGAVVAARARVARSVVLAGAVIDEDAVLEECIVAGGVHVPRGSRYHRSVLVPAHALQARPRHARHGSLFAVPFD